jgi:hypothetical protein
LIRSSHAPDQRQNEETLGLLDVRRCEGGNTPDSALVHWGLAHFLLDGHHKVEAAARAGARLRLLSLLSVDGSLADRPEIERLVAGYATH